MIGQQTIFIIFLVIEILFQTISNSTLEGVSETLFKKKVTHASFCMSYDPSQR
jgi:hypothetical protein